MGHLKTKWFISPFHLDLFLFLYLFLSLNLLENCRPFLDKMCFLPSKSVAVGLTSQRDQIKNLKLRIFVLKRPVDFFYKSRIRLSSVTND